MFLTYLRDPSIFSNPKTFNDVTTVDQSFRTAAVLEETRVFSPAWANSVRVGLDRATALGGYAPASASGNPAATNPALSMFGPNVSGQPVPPASLIPKLLCTRHFGTYRRYNSCRGKRERRAELLGPDFSGLRRRLLDPRKAQHQIRVRLFGHSRVREFSTG